MIDYAARAITLAGELVGLTDTAVREMLVADALRAVAREALRAEENTVVGQDAEGDWYARSPDGTVGWGDRETAAWVNLLGRRAGVEP